MTVRIAEDQRTADAFANSWNNLPAGSVYTREQVLDWLSPLTEADIQNARVLELGCGNGSLLVHVAAMKPTILEGVDLGSSVATAESNMRQQGYTNYRITKADLTQFTSDGFDIVYSIGVLHHLKVPQNGFSAVVRNVAAGGRFHCWVYGREGNGIVIYLVDPLRKIVSRLPWWITKYGVALPLAVPFFAIAKIASLLPSKPFRRVIPLYEYFCWIAQRDFAFFHHVAFDQLVTPQTTYIRREQIEGWLRAEQTVEPGSTYIIPRNGNSWKFGGTVRSDARSAQAQGH
jgi:SAM-dependent methyltransferase